MMGSHQAMGGSMDPASSSASRFARLLPIAASLFAITCGDSATSPPVATRLSFTVHPQPAVAGVNIFPDVVVAVQDGNGNTMTSATNSITLAIGTNPGGGTLSGTTTATAVNGMATFSGLSINRSSNTSYTLTASSPSLTSATSNPFLVLTGPAVKLGFTSQPVNTIARTAIPTMMVAVQDAMGNTVTSSPPVSITLTIGTNPANGILSGGPNQVTTVGGVATFANLRINNPGAGYTLTATAIGLTGATSNAFDVTVGPAAAISFLVAPSTTRPGAVMTPAVQVAVQDAVGNIVTTATNAITVAFGANPASGTLSGTTTVAAVNGIATFSNLAINNPGDGYTLTAATTGQPTITSGQFSIRNPLVFSTVSAGYFHTCGVTTGGAAYCWGENSSGELGNSTLVPSNTPLPVSSGITFAKLVAGRSHTCAVVSSGAAYCWGFNFNGDIGNGVTGGSQTTPAAVSGNQTFAIASAGYAHTCGVTTSGQGYCWGDNSSGQLGNGNILKQAVPAAVSGGLTWASISPGRYFTCGLTTSGVANCWGDNSVGMLGDGTTVGHNTPAPVQGSLTFAAISAGGFHACGLSPAGAAYCWGSNALGQLGDGTVITTNVPVAVAGGLTFATISAGNRHTCGLTTTGAAFCWGDNSLGHLGNGSTTNSSTPVAVSGGLMFTGITAGRFHTCGVVTGGAAYCWGDNASSELGDGTSSSRLVPTPVR